MNPAAAYWGAATLTAKLVLLGVVMLVAFLLGGWAGYAWNADEVEDASAAQADAEEDRNRWRETAEGRANAIAAQNKAHARAVAHSEAAQLEAEAAIRRADAAAEKFLAAKARIEREHAADGRICVARPLCGSPLE